MNGPVSGTSVMVPQAHQGGATRTAGALSPYSLVGLGAGTDSLAAFIISFALWLPPGRLALPCCRTWAVCFTSEPASTSTKHGGQVHFTGPGSQQKA